MAITDIAEARKFAERVVGDIALYNREKIRRALKNDRLFEDLSAELTEARGMYLSRVDAEVELKHNLFNRAVVDIIIKPFAHEETTIW
jgi:hypothetical protein